LIKLCKYSGGEMIRIPTLDELSKSIDALQCFYDVYIKKSKSEIPDGLSELVDKIKAVYNDRNN